MRMFSLYFSLLLWGIFTAHAQDTGLSLVEQAEGQRKKSNPDSAVYFYRRAAVIFEKDKNLNAFINAHNQAGIILTRQDKYAEAMLHLDKALQAGITSPDSNSLLAATTYISLGVVYSAIDSFSLSLKHHFKALKIRERLLGKLSADVATSYGNIGNVYMRANDLQNALVYHTYAMEIRKKLFGIHSDEVSQSFIHLGNVHAALKNYPSAIAVYQMALQNKIAVKGEQHRDVMNLYKKISDAYYKDNNIKQGDFFKKKAAGIKG